MLTYEVNEEATHLAQSHTKIGKLKSLDDFVIEKNQQNQFKIVLVLGCIWLAGAAIDRIWFALDHSVPPWDEAGHLTGSLNYWQALQHPQWFSSEWWRSFWLLSTKIPPLTYIGAALCQEIFGTGIAQANLVHLLSSGILLGAVYGLGAQLFSVEVGLWAAGLCQLLPGLYRYKLDFLIDYPLAAIVTLSFCCLTVWRFGTKQRPSLSGWLWAAGFGLCLGLALMVKQTAPMFLLTPILWVGVEEIRRRHWGRIAQLIGGLCLSVLVFGPWYRTNWLTIITSSKRATIDSAIAKGDPSLSQLTAWTFYWRILPAQISWPLLIVPLVGIILATGYLVWGIRHKKFTAQPIPWRSLGWLAGFYLGGYFLSCLNINKDDRYVLPYLPVLAIFLAYGLTLWGNRIRAGTVALAILLLCLNIFPLGGSALVQVLSPNFQHYPYLGALWPDRQVIAQIVQTQPYLRSTLGVLPSTGQINQHTFDYYGALQNFQVYGRQVGTKHKQVFQDARSLDWFLIKTGDQGSVPTAQAAMVQAVQQSPEFQIAKTWNLPDSSVLYLYQRQLPSVQVQPLKESVEDVKLAQVIIPETSPPGIPVAVTYKWTGSWEQLQSGLVLLTWHNQSAWWLHDHGIGMGAMQSSLPNLDHTGFQVIEHTAMLPPADTPPGVYTLEATYLNRQTGESYSIPVPPVQLVINPQSKPQPAPELDLVTQLRNLAATLPQGLNSSVFEEVGRINEYDPIQDYVVQAQMTLAYRLQQEPQNLNLAYGLALSRVLQQQVNEAIAALKQVTQLDSQNPYAYAYLAFVNLYDWRPKPAQAALKQALALNPNIPEVQALSGVAALMQGNLVGAWHHVQAFKALNQHPR